MTARNDPLAAIGKVLVSLQDESTPFAVFLCMYLPKCSSLHLEIFYDYSPIFVDLFSNVFCSPFHFVSFSNSIIMALDQELEILLWQHFINGNV